MPRRQLSGFVKRYWLLCIIILVLAVIISVCVWLRRDLSRLSSLAEPEAAASPEPTDALVVEEVQVPWPPTLIDLTGVIVLPDDEELAAGEHIVAYGDDLLIVDDIEYQQLLATTTASLDEN